MSELLRSFSVAEISALKLDGELTHSRMLIDEIDTWKERSHSLLSDVKFPAVLTAFSALWALGCTIEPPFHTANHVPFGERTYSKTTNIRFETKIIHPEDCMMENIYGVTTPLRTAMDLLRKNDIDSTTLKNHLDCLAEKYSFSINNLKHTLEEKIFLPHKNVARKRLLSLYYPSETRYTS